MPCPGEPLVGDAEAIELTFRTTAGALADPSSITVKVRHPDGTIDTYTEADAEVTNPGAVVGMWLFTMSSGYDAAGDWWFYVAGSGGGVTAAAQERRQVRAPKMSLV